MDIKRLCVSPLGSSNRSDCALRLRGQALGIGTEGCHEDSWVAFGAPSYLYKWFSITYHVVI